MCPHIIGYRVLRLMAKLWYACVPCVSLSALSLELIVAFMIMQHRDPSSFLPDGW